MSWTPSQAEVDAAENVLASAAGYPPDGFWRQEAHDVLVAAHEAGGKQGELVDPEYIRRYKELAAC